MLEPSDPTAGPVPVDQAVAVRRLVERSTRLTLGLVESIADATSGVIDGLPPGRRPDPEAPGEAGVRDVVTGAVLATQERLLDGTERVARTLGRMAPVGRRLVRLPVVAPAIGALGRQRDALARRGAAERSEGRVAAGAAVERTVASLAANERMAQSVDQVVEALLPRILESALPDVLDRLAAQPELLVPVVDRLLDPILASALPDVLDRLAEEPDLLVPVVQAMLDPILTAALPQVLDRLNEQPEVVRELVLGQSVSIAGEMAGVVRSRGALADDVVERIVRRLTFRRAALPTPRRELGAGDGRGGDGSRS